MSVEKQKLYWLSGLIGTLIGLGISRFAYTALIPLVIEDSWVSSFDAAQLGVAALVGYMIGPIFINVTKNLFKSAQLIKASLIICSLSYIMFSINSFGFHWMYFWRFMAGFGGALLMVLSPTLVLPYYRNAANKGLIFGIVFSGIGIGILISGVVIPFLYERLGLWYVLWFLALLTFLLTMVTWKSWSFLQHEQDRQIANIAGSPKLSFISKNFLFLLFAYCFQAIGYLPHTLFWVDFLVRQMNKSFAFGGFCWAIFGIGALSGPILLGKLSDFIGIKQTILLGFALESFAVFMPIFFQSDPAFYISSFIVGVFTPGMVALTSAYALSLFGDINYKMAWSNITLGFSIFQAAGGMMMSILVKNDDYIPLFYIGGGLLLISFVLILATNNKKTYQRD
ncbi:MFS transporter [Sphingobacterium sp. lm-10]|uniref:YbfB/YjiJ family MFS transporter n=1 Tax=Sphingobacterium sp. lm-10 TaxID=2944904 RepID=UPI002020B5F2|nr:YbfB/YjiJ family MFS transporter [Sphingobacterium sp. lm-10]MCL7988068.1 MFS transporter [Sphingobacterium sp. lm-10]